MLTAHLLGLCTCLCMPLPDDVLQPFVSLLTENVDENSELDALKFRLRTGVAHCAPPMKSPGISSDRFQTFVTRSMPT